jgi:hypothetical protein
MYMVSAVLEKWDVVGPFGVILIEDVADEAEFVLVVIRSHPIPVLKLDLILI